MARQKAPLAQRLWGTAAVAGMLMLAGCGGEATAPAQDLATAGDAEALSQGSERSATRTDSGVVVVPYGGGWLAARTFAFENDVGTATKAIVTLATGVGDVISTPGAAKYAVTVVLQATGPTEAEARRALASMAVAQSDRMGGGTMQMSAKVSFQEYKAPAGQGINVPGVHIGGTDTNVRSASIQAVLPATLQYALSQSTAIGNVSATGLSGNTANFTSDIGDAALDGLWGRASVVTQIGDATFTGDANSFEGLSQIGSVYATLAPSHDVNATLTSQIGDVDLTLAGPATGGFDLYGETEIGAVAIAVHGTQPVGLSNPLKQHWQTPGYAGMSPKVHVEGVTQIGDVSIHD